jgi:DNA-binding SARP family transcriptional activator
MVHSPHSALGTLWRIELFGGLSAGRPEQRITRFPTRRAGALLGFLACHPRQHPLRDALTELLWPEDDLPVARHKLSVTLSVLRGLLEPPGISDGSVLIANRLSVGLNSTSVSIDVSEFESALEAAAAAPEPDRVRHLTTAVDGFGGRILCGYSGDWIDARQRALDEQFFRATREIISILEESRDSERALHYAHRAVEMDALREDAHRDVIRLRLSLGDAAGARRQYERLEEILREELQAEPSAATRQLIANAELGAGVRPRVRGAQSAASTARKREARHSAFGYPRVRVIPRADSELEPLGGAVPLDSPLYVVRPADASFHQAIARRDSIVLLKGARQVGKSSLLARGLQKARDEGDRVVLTSFEALNAADLTSPETLLRALAESIADQLGLTTRPTDVWDRARGPNPNFARYLQREALKQGDRPLVWGLDDLDRLFTCEFGSEILALFRSWHNERALDPGAPWSRLTLAIAYASEAHLYVTDLNQSPFNVGTRLGLGDFSIDEVASLNDRYGGLGPLHGHPPLRTGAEVDRFYRLVGGHPYLVRRGLNELAMQTTAIEAFEGLAASGQWIYGDHLRRMLKLLERDADLCEIVKGVLRGGPGPSEESFYRLRSAGILAGRSESDARPRCGLYAAYLERHLIQP